MRTRSLRRRVLVGGGTVVAAVIVAFGGFVYLALRAQLYGALHALLAERVALAHKLASSLAPARLATRLESHGVKVTLDPGTRGPGGAHLPGSGRAGGIAAAGQLARTVHLPHGSTLLLSVSTAGARTTLDHLILIEILGALAGAALAWLALRRAVSVALAPLDQVVATARGITGGREGDRLRPERTDTELGRLAAAFDEMLDALAAALGEARGAERRSREFLADAAHQLRTPIAGVQASVEAMLSGGAPEDELLANIARETSRAGQLVAALMRLARMDAGALPQRQSCDLASLVRGETERAAALAPALAVQLDVHDSPANMAVDVLAIREALAAVLDNARRHARSRVAVSLGRENGWAAISVADDGPGLPPGSEERAFERFVSLDAGGGSGLGLSLARQVARAQGGDLIYTDHAFVLHLPVATDARPGEQSS